MIGLWAGLLSNKHERRMNVAEASLIRRVEIYEVVCMWMNESIIIKVV